MKNTKEKGIALISLVVTIVVMLILATVTISITSLDDNGLITKTKETKTNAEKQLAITDIKTALLDVITGNGITTPVYTAQNVSTLITSLGGAFYSETNKIIYNGYEFLINLQTGEITYERSGAQFYIPCDYIQSSGTQYIDTGIVGGSNIDIEVNFQITRTLSSASFVFGSRGSSAVTNMYAFAVTGPSAGQHWTSLWNNTQYYGNAPVYDLNRHTILIEGNSYYLDNSILFTHNESDFSSLLSIYLFANNYIGNEVSFVPMKLYYCKIWDNGTLLRDMIPVYDNVNECYCMYDNVTKSFFYNEGTGEFTGIKSV